MASIGAIALVAAAVGAVGAVAAERKGIRTPAGELGRAAGVDISGREEDIDIPVVPDLPSLDIDEGAVQDAALAEKDRIRKRAGRASTITRKSPGLLSAETTGTLLRG